MAQVLILAECSAIFWQGRDWLAAPVHQDVGCLPERHRAAILEGAGFLVHVDARGGRGGGPNIEYTHNLGAWSPSARAAGAAPGPDALMFLTQCAHAHRPAAFPRAQVATFSAPRAHPDLCLRNLVITQLLHLVQGRRGVYFVSNFAAPGNGHDLSCTAGLSVAGAIGAAYPFAGAPGAEEARRDFEDCRKFMGI